MSHAVRARVTVRIRYAVRVRVGVRSGIGWKPFRSQHLAQDIVHRYLREAYASYACPPPMCALWAVVVVHRYLRWSSV